MAKRCLVLTKNPELICNQFPCCDTCCFYGEPKKEQKTLVWRKCKAGYKFPSDAIVIPDDDRTTDRDPRLVRCAVWDSKYILIEDLKKLPVE